ncbi:MAG: tyrosinase family protein, partial [Planctomycetota bacterium]
MIRSDITTDSRRCSQFKKGVLALKNPALFPWPAGIFAPASGLSIYDFFVYWHYQCMSQATPIGHPSRNAAHRGPVFLPWHRYYLMRFEDYLRQAIGDDTFRITYWNFGNDGNLPPANQGSALIWSILSDFLDPVIWPIRLHPHRDGISAMTVMPAGIALQRTLGVGSSGLKLTTTAECKDVIAMDGALDLYEKGVAPFFSPTYDANSFGFRNRLESGQGMASTSMHNGVHNWIGGDMGTGASPNDPVFFLHHANIDRMWHAWQKKHPLLPYLPLDLEPAALLFHRYSDRMFTYFNET